MKIRYLLLLLGIGLTLAVYSQVRADMVDWAEESDCLTVDPCIGIRAKHGRPVGCNRDWWEWGPDPCEGICSQCQSSTSNTVCVWTNNCEDKCLGTTAGMTICGARYESPCSGTWPDDCECGENWSYAAASCELAYCNVNL